MGSEKNEREVSAQPRGLGDRVMDGRESCNPSTCMTDLRTFLQMDGQLGET